MERTKSILVASDFSECSRAALQAAAEWADRLGACLDLIHVWSIPSFPLPPAFIGDPRANQLLVDHPRQQAERDLERFVEQASNAGIFVRKSLLEHGDPAEVVSRIAQREGYDLIVIGTHGRSGLSRLMMGSVAEKIVRLATQPVLSVHAPPLRSSKAA
jgi:nucleotide-binding universal stress UspA family protein